jgi:hypothetical protein
MVNCHSIVASVINCHGCCFAALRGYLLAARLARTPDPDGGERSHKGDHMTSDERQKLIQQHVDENRNRFGARLKRRPSTPGERQFRWNLPIARGSRSHSLPGKPRSFSVWWIATDGTLDRYVNGDMCYDAAVAAAGAMRDSMSDDACSRGTYLSGRTPQEAVAQTGWLPAEEHSPD